MRRLYFLLFSVCLVLVSCGSTSSTSSSNTTRDQDLDAKNRVTISLLDQIRRLPGITTRNGVPMFVKAASSINEGAPFEPLYVLNGYVVGNSFNDINQLVDNVNVDKIEVLSDSDASFYGSRASAGVIKITTRQ